MSERDKHAIDGGGYWDPLLGPCICANCKRARAADGLRRCLAQLLFGWMQPSAACGRHRGII